MSNLVRGMLVGRVNLGGFSQACSTSYSSTEDAMARSIVRLECEAEELRATVAMLQEQARILARERDEAREALREIQAAGWKTAGELRGMARKALEAVSDTPKTDAQLTTFTSISKLKKHFVNRTGTVSADFARKLECERDEARIQYRSTEALAMALVKTIDQLKTEKAELLVKLANLQAGSRPATLEEIRDSVREKYDPEYEFEGRDDE